ncbi:MAG TPA: hypothetical protein DCK95_05215 [Anaerolineaceae bacterium]|nr:hypothetical protein [Anaerolineaceae bacterium]
MVYADIINNAALLLILGILQSLIHHRWIHNSTWGQVIRGVLFGLVAIATMSIPVNFSSGIFFDGRSVVLSIGGLFGGPIVALIASITASLYRIHVGGVGMFTGVGSILIAAGSGIFYRNFIKRNVKTLNFWRLLIFGLCVHIILIGWFSTLPGGVFFDVIHDIAIKYLTVFSLATAILGSVILDQELRTIAEEHSRIDSQKYRTLLETAPDVIMTLDQQGTIHFINHVPDWLGDSNILTESAFSFLDDVQASKLQEKLQHVFSTHQYQFDEFLVKAPNGNQKWYFASLGFLEDENATHRVIVVAKDITQQMNDFKTIQQRTQEIETLYEIGQLIGKSLDIETIYDSFFQSISHIMVCDRVMISSVNQVEKKIYCEYCRCKGKRIAPTEFHGLDLDEDDGDLQSQVINNHHPMIIRDLKYQKLAAQWIFCDENGGNLSTSDDLSGAEATALRSGILVPVILNNKVFGVIHVYSFQENAYGEQELRFLQAIAAQIAVASNNAKLYKDLQLAYDKTLEGWSTALQMREKETAGHTRRVAHLTIELADRMGMTEEEKLHLWRGALLHDIGKLVIPDNILQKPGPLDEEEWEIIKKHPQFAYDWLYPIEYLRSALDIPYSHHEHWDGNHPLK